MASLHVPQIDLVCQKYFWSELLCFYIKFYQVVIPVRIRFKSQIAIGVELNFQEYEILLFKYLRSYYILIFSGQCFQMIAIPIRNIKHTRVMPVNLAILVTIYRVYFIEDVILGKKERPLLLPGIQYIIIVFVRTDVGIFFKQSFNAVSFEIIENKI